MTFLEDFVEITTGAGVEWFEAPIVEDEELDAGEAAQDPGIAAVAAGKRELSEQLGDALVENRSVVTASLVTERTSKPTFADPGGPAQDQIVVGVDPVGIGEVVEQRAVEAARGSVIDIFDAGLLTQSGIAQSRGQPLVTAMGELAIEQETVPVGMAECASLTGGFEFGKGLSHTRKPELAQLVKRRMSKQDHLLMVVARSADIGMEERHTVGGWRLQGLAIELVVEDRAYRAVGQGADLDGP